MTTSATAVLGQVFQSVKDAVSDRELIQRFADNNDQVAFAALVKRHAGMVLGVCRRSLATWQDAEDACQATFLILARKSHSVRWQESLANWLYATARKVARNAHVAATRRARREACLAVPASVSPLDSMTGRELLGALDRELSRLPPRYREPLVLCYLEGLTRDEAAVRLGVGLATLKSQLERGRKQLHAALTRGGFALGAGLLTLAATSSAGAVSPRIINGVLASVSGAPSAAVAALAEGVAWNGLVKKWALAATVIAGFLSLGIGLGSAALPAQAPAADLKGSGQAPNTDAESKVTFAGRVVGPGGEPIPGARVTVVSISGKEDGFASIPAPELTGKDGRFRFDVPKAKTVHPKYGIETPALIATAPGYFPGWPTDAVDGTIRLEKEDAPLRGRVLTLEGQPVAGATVRVSAVLAPTAGTLAPWLAAMKKRRGAGAHNLESEFLSSDRPADVLPGVTLTVTTNAQGKFELAGYGKERVLRAVVSGPTITAREVRFVTHDMETVLLPTFDSPDIPGATAYYGTTGTHLAAPTRPITGVVRDRATLRPLAGVTVKSFVMASNPKEGEQFWATTKSDADGRFTLVGMPKGDGNRVLVIPDDEQPYAVVTVAVPDPPGFDPVAFEIDLVRGVWVEGTVTDRRTGQPVPLAVVEYHPTLDNRTVQTMLAPGHEIHTDERWSRVTGADGRFRALALPGKGYLVAQSLRAEYLAAGDRVGDGATERDSLPALPYLVSASSANAVYEIDVPAEAERSRHDVTFETGVSFTINLLGPDGMPVEGASYFGGDRGSAWRKEDQPGRHLIVSFNPKKPRRILVRHAGKNLVGEWQAPADWKGDTPTVTLKTGVTVNGRILDADGKPKAGLTVQLSFKKADGPWSQFTGPDETMTTDAQGRFRFAGLLPGFSYGVEVNGVHVKTFPLGPTVAGEHDIGDVRLDP